jgi:hypothetical protein
LSVAKATDQSCETTWMARDKTLRRSIEPEEHLKDTVAFDAPALVLQAR